MIRLEPAFRQSRVAAQRFAGPAALQVLQLRTQQRSGNLRRQGAASGRHCNISVGRLAAAGLLRTHAAARGPCSSALYQQASAPPTPQQLPLRAVHGIVTAHVKRRSVYGSTEAAFRPAPRSAGSAGGGDVGDAGWRRPQPPRHWGLARLDQGPGKRLDCRTLHLSSCKLRVMPRRYFHLAVQDGFTKCFMQPRAARVALPVMSAQIASACSSSSNVQCPARLPPYLFCRTSVELPSSDNRADRGQRANGTVSWHAHLGDALKQVRGDGETMPPRAPPGAEDGLDCSIRSGAETCTIECVASAALVCQPCLL